MPDGILDIQLTLDPNNQIARLATVDDLVAGVEYDITAWPFLRPGTRFTFKGRSSIVLTRRPQDVPARRTAVDARISPAPADAVTSLSIVTYPFNTKDRLAAAGLNSSFLPMSGGTLTGALTIAAGGLGVDGDIRLGVPSHPDKSIAYVTRHQQVAGNRRLGLTASDPNNVYYPLDELWINATATTVTGSLSTGGAVGINAGGISINGDIRLGTPTHPDQSIAYITRHQQPAGWRRLGITGSDPGLVYYQLEELWLNAAVVTCTGALRVVTLNTSGAVSVSSLGVAGDLSVGGNVWGNTWNITSGGFYVNNIHTTAGIQVDGNLNAAFIASQGALQVTGAATVHGTLQGLGDLDVNGNVWGTAFSISNTGNASFNGSVSVGGALTVTGSTTTGSLQVNSNAGVGGGLTVTGTLYAQANRINVQGTSAPSVSCGNNIDGNTWGMWSASSALSLGQCDNTGAPTTGILHLTTNQVWPNNDNTFYFGKNGLAWAQMFAYSYITVSDPAVKTNIASVPPGCLDLVCAIGPKTYRLSPSPPADVDRMHWGFLATDVAEAMRAARVEFGGVFEGEGRLGLAYDQLIAVLWQAVRELAEKFNLTGKEDTDAEHGTSHRAELTGERHPDDPGGTRRDAVPALGSDNREDT